MSRTLILMGLAACGPGEPLRPWGTDAPSVTVDAALRAGVRLPLSFTAGTITHGERVQLELSGGTPGGWVAVVASDTLAPCTPYAPVLCISDPRVVAEGRLDGSGSLRFDSQPVPWDTLPGTFYLQAVSGAQAPTHVSPIVTRELAEPPCHEDSYEDNDVYATRRPLSHLFINEGWRKFLSVRPASCAGDPDWFTFNATHEHVLVSFSNDVASPALEIAVQGPDGTWTISGATDRVELTTSPPATYTVRVYPVDRIVGSEFYNLFVETRRD